MLPFQLQIEKSWRISRCLHGRVASLAHLYNYDNILDKMLRDCIIWGINDEPTQRKLLQETDLTYAKAVLVAQGFETANKNLKEMHAPKAEATSVSSTGVHVKSEPMHKVSGKRASTTEDGAQVTYYRCGKPGYLATVCRFCDSVSQMQKEGASS